MEMEAKVVMKKCAGGRPLPRRMWKSKQKCALL